ncbi:hypothetical protein AX16_002670 [Volvariella volvacea WC 439]|nr:hypothetical protein AX16_002670 [Volvariella volvacea WC 439]
MPKSPTVKKAGSPKTKGAIRAKSGCYTCRIRRKKCDEKKDATGSCSTCVRLRLQCLGFGTKRPDWLRDSKKVVELRDKIKTFLASQGMIKGHSGSATRSSEEGTPYLVLSEEQLPRPSSPSSSSSPSERSHYSPPSPDRRPASRQAWEPDNYPPDAHTPPADDDVTFQPTTPPSDYASGHKSDSLASNSLILIPTRASSFGSLYNSHAWDFEQESDAITSDLHLTTPFIDELLLRYRNYVSQMQYLLAGRDILHVLADECTLHPPSYNAITILADIDHDRRLSRAPPGEIVNLRSRFLTILRTSLASTQPTFDDAMAALHAISTYLFDGGLGEWKTWIPLACGFVGQCLESTYRMTPGTLATLKKKHAFIVKTAIWFDVLSALTLNNSPQLLNLIDLFFHPDESTQHTYDLQTSMISPMGSENRVVWALAKTLQLARWKHQQIAMNCLSNQQLVTQADVIYSSALKELIPPYYDNHDDTRLWRSRHLCAQVFRCTTILYLRTVVSGDYPKVHEIHDAHAELMTWIVQVSKENADVVESVVRSTVAGYFLAGVFAISLREWEFVRHQLNEQGHIGNCASAALLVEELRKAYPPSGAIPWQQELERKGILLV